MAAQTNDPEIERSPHELHGDGASHRPDGQNVITPVPSVEPFLAPVSPEQPRGAWVNRFDRTRNRLVLFAATAFLAVALPLGRILSSPQGWSWPATSMVWYLLLLVIIGAILVFPMGLLAPFGVMPVMPQYCLLCDYQAPQPPQPPLLLPLYCLVCLAYFSLPIIGSFPAPQRRTVFVATYLIFVIMLVTNIAGCTSILSPTGPK